MTLGDVEKGSKYIVKNSMVKQPIKRRLEAMGLIDGTEVRKINEALDGSTILMVRGTRIAVGKDIAEDIIVRELDESDKRGYGNRMKRRRHMKDKESYGRRGRANGNIQ